MRNVKSLLVTWFALALAGGAFVAGAETSDEGAPRTTAEIRIGLPAGERPDVTVYPGGTRVVLELPQGATFPSDFESASGGFLANSVVADTDGGRLRLELDVARGVLDHVAYSADSVTLVFRSRFELAEHGDPGEGEYRLGSDDRIAITVYNHPELSTEVTITRPGTVTAPLVGEIGAAGLTVGQLAARLADALERFLVGPQVDVRVTEFESQWVMVAGEVETPGRVSLRGGTQLKEALSEAKGFSDSAGERIRISRRADGVGRPREIVVDRREFEKGFDNPVLMHGDIITIDRASYCYVQGEVGAPGKVEIERGMTLLRALSVAGGLTDWANPKEVRVLKEGESGPGRVYNVKKIWRGLLEDPPLTGGEVIYVGRRSL